MDGENQAPSQVAGWQRVQHFRRQRVQLNLLVMATDWTPDELAALTCKAPGCMLLITLDNHLCAHHAYKRDMSRRRMRQLRRPAPQPRAGR